MCIIPKFVRQEKSMSDILEQILVDEEVLVDEQVDLQNKLIVHNDEVNTFDWVIKALIEICGHSVEQAEQSSMIIHHKGKYAVKHGMLDDLRPMRSAISERGIGATIE